MTLTVVIASLMVFSWKILGYLIPERFITPSVRKFSERVTIALLAALVGIQTFTQGGELTIDARVPAVLFAGLLLWLRVPFFFVILLAAAAAAALRFLGL
jgi:hypothetical protein